MDKKIYLEQCWDILDTNQFTKLSTDPTKKTEEKIERLLQKTESFSIQEQKLPENGTVDKLPIWPIFLLFRNSHLPTCEVFSKTFVPFESVIIHSQECKGFYRKK